MLKRVFEVKKRAAEGGVSWDFRLSEELSIIIGEGEIKLNIKSKL